MGRNRYGAIDFERSEMKTRSEESARQLEKLAFILDSAIRIPGTELRIGLDPIIGLIPGIGDAIGALFGAFILVHAARIGAPKRHLARMFGNLMLDYALGLIPVAGDIFDVTFRANERNLKVLKELPSDSLGPRRDADAVGRLFGYALLIAFGLTIAGLTAIVVAVVRALAG